MATLELALGWGIILGAVYLIARSVDVDIRGSVAGLATGDGRVTSRVTGQRAVEVGALGAGVVVGEQVLTWLFAVLGGFLGGAALDGVLGGGSDLLVLMLGTLALTVFAILAMR